MRQSTTHDRVTWAATAVLLTLGLACGSCQAADAQSVQDRIQASPPEPQAPAAVATADPSSPDLPVVLQPGIVFTVAATSHHPLKIGEPLQARLQYPIFNHDLLALPEGTLLQGSVTALSPDKRARLKARFHGDLTPFHIATVRFDAILLPSASVPIKTTEASNGAPILKLAAPSAQKKSSFLARQFTQARKIFQTRVEFFTAPGLGDRALQILYHQLPYHPERIPDGAAWTFELTEPTALPAIPPIEPTLPKTPARTENWQVNAILKAEVSSKSARSGDPVEALVVEPVFDSNRELVIPQGSTLLGKVSASKAARSLGRNGRLRFNFQQVRFPAGQSRAVQGQLSGALAATSQGLQLDAEGTVTQQNKASALNPLLLTLLAGRALDTDGNLVAQTGVASNGFGLVGRIVGVATGSRNLAAGIGFYAAALSLYENWLTPGRDIVFPRDMRIEIETSPLNSPVLKRDELK